MLIHQSPYPILSAWATAWAALLRCTVLDPVKNSLHVCEQEGALPNRCHQNSDGSTSTGHAPLVAIPAKQIIGDRDADVLIVIAFRTARTIVAHDPAPPKIDT
jgi:hypothetical protein